MSLIYYAVRQKMDYQTYISEISSDSIKSLYIPKCLLTQIYMESGSYNKINFVVRIFGIWSDDNRCGLNYQIIPRTEKHLTMKREL